jgi:hypothetical protein
MKHLRKFLVLAIAFAVPIFSSAQSKPAVTNNQVQSPIVPDLQGTTPATAPARTHLLCTQRGYAEAALKARGVIVEAEPSDDRRGSVQDTQDLDKAHDARAIAMPNTAANFLQTSYSAPTEGTSESDSSGSNEGDVYTRAITSLLSIFATK